MRAVRLRSHAIGSYRRPESEAPLATLVLALIAVAGVMLPWADGSGWSKRGWSYEQGLVALGAAAATVCISAARLSGKIGRTWFEALGLAFALTGLGTTLSFYFKVVGSTDPASEFMQLFAALRTIGATGVYVSMAGFLAQTAVFMWHLDFRVQLRLRKALCSPWTAVAMIGVAAIGVRLPWDNSWPTPHRGWSFDEGLVALAAAAGAAIICGLRLSRHVRLRPYALLGLVFASVGIAAVVWFHQAESHTLAPSGYPLLVSWLNAPRLHEGLRESVTAAGFMGTMAILGWQLWQGYRSNL